MRETELEDPEAQILSLEAFEMKLRGEKEDTKTVSSSLNWSDEIEQILVKYRENLRLRNPKRWTKETILRKFRTLRMQDMNVERFEEDTKEFKRLRSLSISRNSISMLKNLPLNLKALYAFRNNIREVDTNTE